jgi:DNA-binding GntR family transcriptional regulator
MTAPGDLADETMDQGRAPEDQALARALALGAAALVAQPLPGGGLEGLRPTPQMQQRRTVSNQVADTLRNAINQGILADGTPLNQVAIAKMLGVSRVPVREAMHQLQAEGLITVRPHHGAVVTGLSVERVSELYEIQALLEEYIAARAIPNIDTATMSQLRSLVTQMRKTPDLEPWLALNANFHTELNQPSGATLAIELVQQLSARGQRYVNLWSNGKGIDRPRDANDEHELILDFITAGDVDAACTAVKQHVLATRDKAIGYHEARANAAG